MVLGRAARGQPVAGGQTSEACCSPLAVGEAVTNLKHGAGLLRAV